jgi:hypothetical protein
MDPRNRKGSSASFRKFLIRTIEQGCQLSDEQEQETISIIYDRRGLEYKHIDPILHQMSRMTVDSLRNFYGSRLGVIYVVHANWFFWAIFTVVLKPFLSLISKHSDKIVLLNDSDGLIPYFDEDQLFLVDMKENETTVRLIHEQLEQQIHGEQMSAKSTRFESDVVQRIDIIRR